MKVRECSSCGRCYVVKNDEPRECARCESPLELERARLTTAPPPRLELELGKVPA